MKIIANDSIITECCSRASLQINEFMPILAHSLLESLDLLININPIFAKHVEEIKANKEKCRKFFDRSPTIITALLPFIGYEKAQILLEEFSNSGKENLREFLVKELGKEMIEKAFSPYNLISLGYKDEK
jgi:aspartate ammonia-lyase